MFKYVSNKCVPQVPLVFVHTTHVPYGKVGFARHHCLLWSGTVLRRMEENSSSAVHL